MNELHRRTTLIWLVLIAVTIVSLWLGVESGHESEQYQHYATGFVLFIAFFKVRLIILHFMEVSNAPRPLRFVLETWVVVVFCAILGLFVLTPGRNAENVSALRGSATEAPINSSRA